MIQRLASKGLILSILLLFVGPTQFAQTRQEMTEEQRAARIEKIRKGVAELGTGEKAKIKVKVFENKTKYRGTIKSVSDNGFTIIEKKTGAERTFRYDEVRHISGKNLAFGTKVLIIVGAAAAAVIVLMNIILSSSDS